MMKSPILYALIAVLFAGCSDGTDMPEPVRSGSPIVFGAANGSSTAAGSRSLIGNEEDGKPMEKGMTTLEDICTPVIGGEAIAVWGDYCQNGFPSDRVEYTTVFQDTHLIYDNTIGNNPKSAWNYTGPERYWMHDCSYRFRSYFPATVEPISSSNIMTLSLEYQSNRAQDDLMVAYNEADTGAPGFDPTVAVELYFRHTLAALRFKFELGYDNSDKITACWLENGVRDDFAVGGILFCERREEGGRIFTKDNPPTDKELDAYFRWMKGCCPERYTTGLQVELHRGPTDCNIKTGGRRRDGERNQVRRGIRLHGRCHCRGRTLHAERRLAANPAAGVVGQPATLLPDRTWAANRQCSASIFRRIRPHNSTTTAFRGWMKREIPYTAGAQASVTPIRYASRGAICRFCSP